MRNIDLFDDYLHQRLPTADKKLFEHRLETDTEFKTQFEEHKNFITLLKELEKQERLKNTLQTIYKEEYGEYNTRNLNTKNNFYEKYGRTIGIAASVALFAVIATIAMLSSGGYLIKQHQESITNLSKEITHLKSVQEGIIDGIKTISEKRTFETANIEGTGFALNNNGYFLTSLHMVGKADSVFVIDEQKNSYKAGIVFSDTRLDIAVLKLENDSNIKSFAVPYSFKNAPADIGEKVYTMGFPAEDMVYGEGSISSLKGSSDTAMYQISVPINPGNSGGPLFDEQGNVIGLIKSKNSNAEGTGFAIKSNYIIQLLNSIENDSLKTRLQANKKNNLKTSARSQQLKRISSYVYNVKVFKGN
ncbi:MAG: trypsin-like peptidase domain-containing protein [Bacteroidetes bacterium]|nr:trypsin-like peptidase domain-containing protein [Bacteroidota bacterium]